MQRFFRNSLKVYFTQKKPPNLRDLLFGAHMCMLKEKVFDLRKKFCKFPTNPGEDGKVTYPMVTVKSPELSLWLGDRNFTSHLLHVVLCAGIWLI